VPDFPRQDMLCCGKVYVVRLHPRANHGTCASVLPVCCLAQVLTSAFPTRAYETHQSHILNSGCACELALPTNLGHGDRYDQFEITCFFLNRNSLWPQSAPLDSLQILIVGAYSYALRLVACP
jgi:hypothetical protein